MTTQMAIQWNNVSYSIRQGFWLKYKRILQQMNLNVPWGQVLGLVGPNGAGKTTTIKLGAGLLTPEMGEVLINGKPAHLSTSRTHIGLLTETQYIYHHLKLKEWLEMMASLSGLNSIQCRQRVTAMLEQFELHDRADQMMHTLSKGQLQRAGLAQAMVHDPKILFLDEPMSGLDPYWRYRVQQILRDYKNSGGTIVFSSHVLVDVERLSDQIALIEGGRLKWNGNLSDMKRDIKAYEMVCRTDQPDILIPFAIDGKLIRQPEGEYLFSIYPDQKNELMKLTTNGVVAIESLRPVRQEIEEILFGLNKMSSDNPI